MSAALNPSAGSDSTPESNTNRILRAVTWISLTAAVLAAAVGTVHWPIVGDAPLFHYIAFLMDHGMKPYREITNNSMPGSYLTEAWAMQP